MMYAEINNWDDSPKAVEEPLTVGMMPAKEEFFEFYKLNYWKASLYRTRIKKMK